MAITRSHRWLQRTSFGVLMVLVITSTGCAPQTDPQQYGKILQEVPRVEGADEPYRLPELEESATGSAGDAAEPQK